MKVCATGYDRPSIGCTQPMIDHENPSRFLSLMCADAEVSLPRHHTSLLLLRVPYKKVTFTVPVQTFSRPCQASFSTGLIYCKFGKDCVSLIFAFLAFNPGRKIKIRNDYVLPLQVYSWHSMLRTIRKVKKRKNRFSVTLGIYSMMTINKLITYIVWHCKHMVVVRDGHFFPVYSKFQTGRNKSINKTTGYDQRTCWRLVI